MALLIGDSNIFIDFEEGGLLEALFRLPEEVGVPDLLFEEELRGQHEALLDDGLVLVQLTPETLQRVVRLASAHRKPSRLDLAALAAAEQEACPLLTGDRNLRAAATTEGVEVHGTLWVARRLVDAGVVSVSVLREAYAKMEAGGRRLPWDKVAAQLEELERSG